MTPKQLLDSFSETLMQDERILSAQERALLRNLMLHAKSASLDKPETQSAVTAVIASAIGETVAQRAFAVLGGSVVERILGGAGAISTGLPDAQTATINAGSPPTTPSPPPGSTPGTPGTPGPPRASIKAPTVYAGGPPTTPSPPPGSTPGTPGTPGPPRASTTQRPTAGRTAVLEYPGSALSQCLVLDEFLAPDELQELTRYALEREADFYASEVVGPDSSQGLVNHGHRSSRVLMDLGPCRELILGRIQSALPLVLSRLGMEEFSITHAEAQITASNDGDFFRSHRDNGDAKVASRQLTFVYFFHREPSQFSGGELRIHDPAPDGDGRGNAGTFQTIVPRQNQIVFFPCSVQHEITPVECPSRLFADSRFTLNGWLHK
jgi:SM-20-related protein